MLTALSKQTTLLWRPAFLVSWKSGSIEVTKLHNVSEKTTTRQVLKLRCQNRWQINAFVVKTSAWTFKKWQQVLFTIWKGNAINSTQTKLSFFGDLSFPIAKLTKHLQELNILGASTLLYLDHKWSVLTSSLWRKCSLFQWYLSI